MNIWSVIVAGGSGARFGTLKQLEMLSDQRVIDWSLAAMNSVSVGTVVVVPGDHLESIAPTLPPEIVVVAGGDSRAGSVRAGLAALGPEVTHVLVHDAARPLASAELVQRVVDALSAGADGVVPVVPVTDTLRSVDGEPVDRSQYVAVQTPQGFELQILKSAHSEGGEATDDATLVTRNGGTVVHVAGEERNMKITMPHDLQIAQALL